MRITAIVLIASLFLVSCTNYNKIMKSKDPEKKLQVAEKYFASKKYSKAQQLYEQLFTYYQNTDKFEDLYYKYAYCAYYMEDYTNADNLFKRFLEVFPNSPRAEEMDYMRAYVFYKQSPKAPLDQTSTSRTINMMQVFINTHPNSPRIKEATDIMDKCRVKLEEKEFQGAELYYNLGQFRAAGISFNALLNNFPESARSDEYKVMVIRSYFKFASNSIEEKKAERFEQVISECNEFTDRFTDSKYSKEVERFLNLSQENLKAIKNEQGKTATGR